MQLWQWVILMASYNHTHWDFDKEEATENSKWFKFNNGQASLVYETKAVWQLCWAWHTSPSPLSCSVHGMDSFPLQTI